MPRFSLVLCTIHRREELDRLFESIVRQGRSDLEVLVIDQNRDDRIVSNLNRFAGQIPLTHIRVTGTGASRARNIGIDHARGDLIAFPDDDCFYLDGCLDAVDKLFQEEGSIDCITGNPTAMEGASLKGEWRNERLPLDQFSILNRCQEFTIFLRREKLAGIRYNERLGVGANTLWGAEEGPDFLIRLVESGARTVFFPDLLVFHPDKVLTITPKTLERALSYARGRGCLLRLHRFPLGTILAGLMRPALGCVLYLLLGQRMRSIYYLTMTRGLLRGLRMSEAELQDVRSAQAGEARPLAAVAMPALSREPLVSVLVANFNYARFLPEALESLLAQSYSNWHAVVCDDGSTDHSLQVIQKYAAQDGRIYLLSKTNGGQNSTYNACFQQARGEIVCFLDADDIFHADKLRRVVDAFQSNPAAGICNHFSQVVNADTCPQPITMHNSLDEGWLADRAVTCGACVYAPTTSCMSLRRNIADILFPIPIRQERDLDGYLAMASQFLAPIVVIHEQLSSYRIHTSNMGGITEPTRKRLEYELQLIEMRASTVKDFAKQRFGGAVAERIVLADNPQYIQTCLKLLAIAPPQHKRLRAMPLIRRHPNGTWRMIWTMVFAVPKPLTRLALTGMHRCYRTKTLVHGWINRRRPIAT